jgi:hypothetical protein
MRIGTAYIGNNILHVVDHTGVQTYSQWVPASAWVAGYTDEQVTLVFPSGQNINLCVVVNGVGTIAYSNFR